MRTLSCLLAAATLTLAARDAGAADVSIVAGSVALATFHQTSADGCIAIDGELAVVQATRGGELADGLYVTATRQGSCTPDNGNGYAAFSEGRFYVVPLVAGRFTGTVTVSSYSGGPPLTLDLDLRWLGTGKVTRNHNVYRDGSTINFSFDASRAATTRGRFTIDGAPATVTSATLAAEASGTVTR